MHEALWRIPAIFALLLALAGCTDMGGGVAIDAVDVSGGGETSEYVVGPGDTLNIFVWQNPEVSGTVPVRPDGRISMPLVEDMVAVGKTPSELARDLETELSQYIRSPKVNVIVTDFVGTFGEQIRVVGKAAEPRSIPYRAGMTVLDVIIQAGGLAEGAAGNRSRIVRRGEDGTQNIRVRLSDLLNRGDTTQDLRMRPGDVLIIPESRL